MKMTPSTPTLCSTDASRDFTDGDKLERSRVLVVEDRPSVLKLLATILDDGYDVVTASDGATALDLIASSPVDVVLTDIRMPGASGFDVLTRVRERAPRTDVVMMTAFANVPDAVKAMRLGAYDYVAKPFDADEILLVVARAVEHLRESLEVRSAAQQGEAFGSEGEDLQQVAGGFHRAVEEARDRASRDYLSKLLRVFHGNVTEAATQAGMTRESLHRVMKKYGVRSAEHRSGASVEACPAPSERCSLKLM